jgi:hypothetical protein
MDKPALREPRKAPHVKLDPELVAELRRSYEQDEYIKIPIPSVDSAESLIYQAQVYAQRTRSSFKYHFGTTDGQVYLSFMLAPKRAYTKKSDYWENRWTQAQA